MPPVVVLTPFYIMLAQFGLIDTWIGLILLYSTFNLAFCVVIMRDIFRDVSKEVEEAARIEGGQKALESTKDPMIDLARLVDSQARELRKIMETQGEVKQQAHAKIA